MDSLWKFSITFARDAEGTGQCRAQELNQQLIEIARNVRVHNT